MKIAYKYTLRVLFQVAYPLCCLRFSFEIGLPHPSRLFVLVLVFPPTVGTRIYTVPMTFGARGSSFPGFSTITATYLVWYTATTVVRRSRCTAVA